MLWNRIYKQRCSGIPKCLIIKEIIKESRLGDNVKCTISYRTQIKRRKKANACSNFTDIVMNVAVANVKE